MHEDLFEQARSLALADAMKPKQANLRRAVSATYYAMFHVLVDEACCVLMGTQHRQAPYRHILGRAFTHSAMKQACTRFGSGSLKPSLTRGLPNDGRGYYSIPSAIRGVSSAFTELQEKRHLADYDRAERFSRSEVLMWIQEARDSVSKFLELPTTDDKRFFLACLWAWRELSKR